MREQARSQDFIALYSRVQEDRMNSNKSIVELITQMQTLQTNHNTSIADLDIALKIFQKNQSTAYALIESKMREANIRNNQSFINLQRQIDNTTELVAMIAHPSSTITTFGILKFDNVQFSSGMNNLPAFKTTGKFVCEKEGMYMISVSIYSQSKMTQYNIYLNGNRISATVITFNSNSASIYNTGTVVLALPLRQNDSLWISYPSHKYIESGIWSTLTIVKLK